MPKGVYPRKSVADRANGSHRAIGRRFGISHTQVGVIKRGEQWRTIQPGGHQ